MAWLGHRPTGGGAIAAYSQETVQGLRSRGIDVEEVAARASLQLVKPLAYSPPAARRALATRLKEGGFDLVHASFWFSSLDFELPELCRSLGIPLVVTFHVAFDQRIPVWAGLTKATYRVYARTLRHCRRVIVFSRLQADLLRELGLPEENVVVLPHGVDVDAYRPGPSSFKRARGARHLFVYQGRMDAEHNVDVLIRAFLSTVSETDSELLLVGTGTSRRRLQRAFQDPRVVFAGQVQDEGERIGILRAADGFLLPSTSEVLSMSLLQAMACGAPTVAADVGSDGEALRGAGIVMDPLRLEGELRLALRSLTELPGARKLLGEAARRRAVERFSLTANLDRLVALYGETAA